MSYANGKIFVDTSVTPNVGASIYDVQRALGTNKNDLGQLCTHSNIKIWAKYKPVIVSRTGNAVRVAHISDSDRAAVNYGITNIPKWSLFSNMVNFWTAYMPHQQQYSDISQWAPECGVQSSYWTYQAPTGGVDAPYRLTDFVSTNNVAKGYYNQSEPPIGVVDVAEVKNTLVSITYKMNYEGVTEGLTVTLSDLSVMTGWSYQNLYFGVAIKAGNDIYLATQSTPVGTMDTTGWTLWSLGAHARFKVDSNSGTLFTYLTNNTPFYVFPILSSEMRCYESSNSISAIRPYSQGQGGTFIALGEKESIVLEIACVYASINMIEAWKSASQSQGKYVYYYFIIQNSDAELPHTFVWNLYVKDSGGTTLASVTNQTVSNLAKGASQSISSNINVGSSFSGAVSVLLEVSVSSTDTATYTRTTYATTTIYNDL